jgi:hypothetical protein
LGLLRHPEPEVVRKVLKAELKANRRDLLRREVLDYLVERRDFPHFALEFLRYVGKWAWSIEKRMGEEYLLGLLDKVLAVPDPDGKLREEAAQIPALASRTSPS